MTKSKSLVLLITLILSVSLVLVGCGNDEGTATTAPKSTPSPKSTVEATTEPPATTEAKETEAPTEAPSEAPKNILFSDDFSGDLSKWEVHGGNWRIEDGKLVLDPEDNGPKVVAKDTNFKNFVIEADISLTDVREGQPVHNAGFVFHVSDPGTGADAYKGYYVGISLDHAIAGKAIDGQWLEFGQFPLDLPLEFGDKVKIRLVVKDGFFEFYVDDMSTPVAEFDDIDAENEPYESGSIGLRNWQNGATYDNVVVYELED